MKSLGDFLRLMFEFLRRDARIALSYRLQFFFQVTSVLSVAITFFFVSLMMRDVERLIPSLAKYGGGYLGFVLVGIAFSSYLNAALQTFATAIRQAQMTGTLEAMLSTKTRIGPLIAGSAVYPLSVTTFRSVLFLASGTLLGVHFYSDRIGIACFVLVLTVASTMVLGIFSAGFIVLFKQGDPLTAAIGGLSWLLSGILYPKEILPAWVQRLADLLPMTHTLEAMRLLLLAGAPSSAVAPAVVYLGGFAVVGIPIAVLWFGWAVERARIDGSLAKY